MRKITSKSEEKKKSRVNQLVIGISLILVMVLSILGYSIGKENNDDSEIITYNGIKFTNENNRWVATISDMKFSFGYNPNEVTRLNTTLNQLNSYYNKPIYIYSKNYEVKSEIYTNLVFNQIAQRMQDACLEGENCNEDVPIKTCSDIFIVFKESQNTLIKQQDNCVFIEGKSEDLIKLADSYLFKLIGIQ